MKKWSKTLKPYVAAVLILITSLVAFMFFNIKDTCFNQSSLAGFLGRQQSVESSKSELQNKAGVLKVSPTPVLFYDEEPEPVSPVLPGKIQTYKLIDTNKTEKDETQPDDLAEKLSEPDTSGETATGIREGSDYLSPGVYVEEIQLNRPIQGVFTDITAFVGITETKPVGNDPLLIRSFLEYQQHYGGYLPESMGQYGVLPYAVKSFFENGGTRCYIISIKPEDINHIVSDDFLGEGIKELEQLKDVRIVAVPGVFDLDIQQGLIDHCEAMKDRFAIMDMPTEVMDVHDLLEHRDHFDSSYAAFYHPWIQTHNLETGEARYIPPSGAIAGIYCANDRTRGVHKTPANIPVAGITDLKYTVTENELQALNVDGINVIRLFQGRGNMVWGARTCSSDEEYKYINVKRYVLYLNQSIREGTEWIVFEPNNEQLWAKTIQSVDNFLNNEWRNGALMGTKPDEAYFVKMDRTTMTANDIEQGKKIMILGVAVIKPAEFLVISVFQE
ncbi:MAG: phage tail sheath subtilisin-like domain-containing protein [Ruminiclostridium sp.]|nr:phage tail sheath subtilisin-like domain-containing protein [Ruminiclostridium sp.]